MTMEVGDHYTFRPACLIESHNVGSHPDHECALYDHVPRVQGEIIMIHQRHHWFRVRYVMPSGCVYHECFPLPSEPEETPAAGRGRGVYERHGLFRPSVWRDGI